MRSIQQLLSEVAYLQRSCEYLVDALQHIETAGTHLQELDPMQEAMVESATTEAVGAIKGHLDIATRFAEEWQTRLQHI
ncbi:hypothetical protein ACFT5D_07795 [Streptomyces sp. NPDC057144]|uniref:hypothetical protein n=1 Tax=Streptomyces sp. NPDC057144 TaxID=3346034 RepID=UPI00362DBA42